MTGKIKKAPETMSAKERVRRTFQFEKTDRVTIGYEANMGIHEKLCSYLEIRRDDREALLDALGVDYYALNPKYTGPQLFQVPPNRQVDPLEGAVMRWVEHPSGGYWDFCDFPLKDADEEAFAAFPVPDADNFDYDTVKEEARYFGKKLALHVGNAGMSDIINSNGRLMGMEDILCELLLGEDYVMDFIQRRVSFQLKMLERTIHAAEGNVDFLWIGEDLGTQIAPMISLDLYRERLKPIHKQFVDLADAYRLPVLIHTCGSSSWFYEDFIDIGIRGVDTLQPEAINMSPKYLQKTFGGRLNFRGCISTAGPLATGTPEETRTVCRDTLDIMKQSRGYHFAPTHMIQDNTPVENVVAMYQAAHDFGRY